MNGSDGRGYLLLVPSRAGAVVLCVVSALLASVALPQRAVANVCDLLPSSLVCKPEHASQAAPSSSAPQPSGGQLRGFSDPGLGNRDLPRSLFMDRLADSGAQLHRIETSWQGYEPRRGHYTSWFWDKHDRDYRDKLKLGVREVIILRGTPYWALTPEGRGSTSPGGIWRCDGSQSPCNAPPNVRDPGIRDAWEHWVREVVSRYPQAAGIEIWNEPNIRWNWYQPQDPALYALMLKSAGEAVRQVNPSMPVVSGGVSSFQGASDADKTSYDEFLRTVYRDAGPDSFSAIGWHAYPCFSETYHGNAERQLQVIRQVKREFGDASKPIWLTETGATTGRPESSNCGAAFSEPQQHDALEDVLRWAGREQAVSHDLPVVLVHSLFDWGKNGSQDFGVIAWYKDPSNGNVQTRAKPAYPTVRCIFRGSC
jgi:putative glycosyl hydrolase